jgi:ADP-heptose:LPS heptosyltransferase
MRKRILVIKLGAFGDIIVSDGAFEDVRRHHPDDEITILTGPAYGRLFERSRRFDRILFDPRAPRWRLDLMYRLNRTVDFDGYDMVYDLQNSRRTMSYFRRFVKQAAWSGKAAGCSHPYTPPPGLLSVQQESDQQLRAAGIETGFTTAPDLSWMAEDVTPIMHDAGIGGPYVVLLPGASARNMHKCWPGYAALAQRLVDAGICVVTVPGPVDMEQCKALPGITLTGSGEYLDFFQLAGVLQGAAYVVGNDSGPTHLAAHLGAPGVALFGSCPERYRLNMKRNNFDCLFRERIADIDVDEVFDGIVRAMAGGQPASGATI